VPAVAAAGAAGMTAVVPAGGLSLQEQQLQLHAAAAAVAGLAHLYGSTFLGLRDRRKQPMCRRRLACCGMQLYCLRTSVPYC
jgi:hypothetical protein